MKIKSIFAVIVIIFAIIGLAFSLVYIAMFFGLTNESGIIDKQQFGFISKTGSPYPVNPLWTKTEEWLTLKEAIKKDRFAIEKAANDAKISPRLLVAILVPEQLRLFHSEREIFKEIFSPLQILGNQNQFSWGIMGIKQETAIEIENNLKATTSDFYLGKEFENVLDYSTSNSGEERFARLTNEKEHYYNYYYASLFVRQIVNSWQKAGHDIQNRPEIIATLFNIGFKNSKPKSNPSSGGSSIELNGNLYSFGQLAGEFYYSNELIELFPQ